MSQVLVRTAAGSLGPVFDPSHVEHWAGSARRQAGANPRSRRCSRHSCGRIPGEHDEPCGRQLDGLLAGQDRANDFRREIRKTHEHRQIIAPHAKPRRHGVDAVITARKEHVAGCDRSGDQGGKAVVDRFRGAIADHRRTPFVLLEKKPARLVSVAVANKTARIAWALLVRKENYRVSVPVAA